MERSLRLTKIGANQGENLMWPSCKRRSASEIQEQPLGPDADTIRRLALLLTECGLTEIEYQVADCCMRVARTTSPSGTPHASEIAQPVEKTPTPRVVPQLIEVGSLHVGFPKLVNDSDGAPFVRIGNLVRTGQLLLYIDVLKVMHPVVAPCDGRVVDVLLVQQHDGVGYIGVGYGDSLVTIEPTELSTPSIP